MFCVKDIEGVERYAEINRREYVRLNWAKLNELRDSETARIQFDGVGLSRDLSVMATFCVFPYGEDKPIMVAVDIEA